MSDSKTKRIIIGIGNSSRTDDGLGWAYTDNLEGSEDSNTEIIQRFQLQVEDAEMISHFDEVIFVDACTDELDEGFELRTVIPAQEFAFTTHALAPETVLHLCQEVYGATPETKLLVIQGYDWELKEGLSSKASENLSNALKMNFSLIADTSV